MDDVNERGFPKLADLFIRTRTNFNYPAALKTSLPDSHIARELDDFIFLPDGANNLFGCSGSASPDSKGATDFVNATASDVHADEAHAVVCGRANDIESRLLQLFIESQD